jgi:hypothetical protein
MTKTYNDIEAVNRLLEEVWKKINAKPEQRKYWIKVYPSWKKKKSQKCIPAQKNKGGEKVIR